MAATAAEITVADEGLSVRAEPEPEGRSKEALFLRLKKWVTADLRHSGDWRREARTSYDMVAGHQWEKAEESAFEEQGKAPIKFNRVISVVKAVAGHEINNRHELRFYPRGVEDTAANEVLNAASQWMGDHCDAEDEESDAFEDTVICGMGWTEHIVSYDDDPEGEYQEVRVDPLEMAWDANAKRKNLADAKRVHRVRRDIDLAEAKRMFPNVDEIALDAKWVTSESEGHDPVPVEDKRKHESGISKGPDDSGKKVTLVDTQWIETRDYYLVASEGQSVEMTPSQFRVFEERAKAIGFAHESVRLNKKVYRRAFLGATGILHQSDSPAGKSFTYTCITGERDRNAGTWFGLVSVMRDPQKFANKWLTNTLHILNVTAKGGVMAEKDAFDDQRQAEDSWAQPQDITWLKDGAISGPVPKIREKPVTQFPAGYFQLMQFAISSIWDASGVNPELMGIVDRNQPGILEAQRKQAAVTILATLLNNLRRFRKAVGRVRLHYIQTYLSDGRLIRVTGPLGAKAVPLVKDKTLGRYDVVIDESATGVNQKAETWAMVQAILPAIREYVTPEILLIALKYSPLPTSLLAEIEAVMAKGGEDPEAEQQKQVVMQQVMTALDKDRASAMKDKASAQRDLAESAKTVAETKQIGSLADPQVQNLLRMAADAGLMG